MSSIRSAVPFEVNQQDVGKSNGKVYLRQYTKVARTVKAIVETLEI